MPQMQDFRWKIMVVFGSDGKILWFEGVLEMAMIYKFKF